jgi:deoxyribonuclease-2
MQKLLLGLFAFFSGVASLSCHNDDGATVDYTFAVKGPKGTSYVYYDSETPLAKSPHSMNDTSVGFLGTTLKQLWSPTTEYMIFNDEPPGQKSYNFTVGHTKGVWAWDLETGDAMIIQHSIPLFPIGPRGSEKYLGLGSNAWMYGQHVACFSLKLDDLVRLVDPALLTVPSVYDMRVSAETPGPLVALASGSAIAEAACISVSISTVSGLNVTMLAKSTSWNNELYAACVAPRLDASLAVESWLRGSEEGPSCTGPTTVVDVQSLTYPGGFAFSEYNDHSKWAVADNGSWFCPADINRMTTQYKRGGAAYCFQDTALANAILAAIAKSEAC